MKKLLAVSAAIAALSVASTASAVVLPAWTGPHFGSNTAGPSVVILLNSNGTATVVAPAYSTGPYDGADDTFVGIFNNSGATVGSIHLTSTLDIFGFEGDGINAYGASGNAIDTSGYGGPFAYFTNVNAAKTIGDVNFIGGIANGAFSYFSLEENLDAAAFTAPITTTPGGAPEPASWAMMMLGFAGLGAMLRRRRSATVAA